MTDTTADWHGTRGGYTNHHCRCSKCRAAWAEYNRMYKARRTRRPLPPGDPRHGTPYGYSGLGCRCSRCRAAWAADKRKREAEKRNTRKGARHAARKK